MDNDQSTFRPLSDSERAVLARLLEADFPGRDPLAIQLDTASARTVDKDGSIELRLAPEAAKADVVQRIATEGFVQDRDGVVINVLLHVVDGFARELEFWRDDLKPPIEIVAQRLHVGPRFNG